MKWFELDQDAVASWLVKSIEVHAPGLGDVDPDADRYPELTHGWRASDGLGDAITELIRKAVAAGIIRQPHHAANPGLDVYVASDADDDTYQYVVRIALPWLNLVSDPSPVMLAGDPDAIGAFAALAILEEAVTSANAVLASLDEYAAAVAA